MFNNFDDKKYVKDGLLDAVGKKSRYWITHYSMEWYKIGYLTKDDLAELDEAMTAKEEEEKAMLEGMESEQNEVI